MPSAELDKDAVSRELEDILKSAGFARNERLSCFLRFVVERHLEGRDHEIKEAVIGAEVFGRKADYSPKIDPIVRTEARRLRERLRHYYEGSGAKDAVRIELPKGGYVPEISHAQNPSVESPSAHQENFTHRAKWWLIGLGCVSAAVVIAVFGFTSESR